ncbi:MAG: hypothetical protein Q7R52_02620 [archaeon]|nr:hypothetical protein [archaeon]
MKCSNKKESFRLEVDYGKPYSQKVNSECELRNELLKLKDMNENDDFGYLDLEIYKGKKDVTDKMFEKLKIVD